MRNASSLLPGRRQPAARLRLVVLGCVAWRCLRACRECEPASQLLAAEVTWCLLQVCGGFETNRHISRGQARAGAAAPGRRARARARCAPPRGAPPPLERPYAMGVAFFTSVDALLKLKLKRDDRRGQQGPPTALSIHVCCNTSARRDARDLLETLIRACLC